MIFRGMAQHVVELVGEELGIAVEDANPVEPLDLVELPQQLGQPRPAVEVDAVVGHVLRDQDQLADAVAGQLLGLGDDHLDRLGHVLAPHEGDRAEGAKPVAPFRDLEVGEVTRRDPQPRAIVLGLDRRRPEQRALLVQTAQQPVGHPRDLFAAEHADDVVDLGELLEQTGPSAARPGSRRRSPP